MRNAELNEYILFSQQMHISQILHACSVVQVTGSRSGLHCQQ